MNKQPSKESLKDKVKGIFGIGPPRPPTKQTDHKPSEFIINSDILKVSDGVVPPTASCDPAPLLTEVLTRRGAWSQRRPPVTPPPC